MGVLASGTRGGSRGAQAQALACLALLGGLANFLFVGPLQKPIADVPQLQVDLVVDIVNKEWSRVWDSAPVKHVFLSRPGFLPSLPST